jgi:tRNA-splicing ligase RtcB (3'-phosphate/5'-hydroxy nucleic acid ligase)
MPEEFGDFEWRGKGEEAEIALYAPDAATAEGALRCALPAARLPGVESPVHAAASDRGFGRVAVSGTHAAPDLFSAPEWGLLLVADAPVEALGVPFSEAPRLLARRLAEVALPEIGDAALRELLEAGASWAAGEGFIEEDDLAPFVTRAGDPDALGRRALSAGTRDWARPGNVGVFRVAEVFDSEGAGEMGLEIGALAVAAGAGAEDLGRLALAGHRERISSRSLSGDFGAMPDLPAAPTETEEARDLVAASAAAANYAAGRAALIVWALRRALREAGMLRLRAAWPVGGLEEQDESLVHRDALAAVGEGEALAAGRVVAAGTGKMLGSAPPFGAAEVGGGWPWEEAGLCERLAALGLPGSDRGEAEG